MWLAIGLLAGAGHAGALWHSASRAQLAGWNAPLRLTLVALVLVSAAIERRLLPNVAGWACGLAVTVLFFCRRKPA